MKEFFLLIFIGFFAGIINTLAGGGSLLTLPALIFLGLPPSIANGTNRIAIFIQMIVGSAGFKSKGIKTFPFSIYLGVAALLGSIIGANAAITISDKVFTKILSFVMITVVLLLVLKPKLHQTVFTEKTTGKNLIISCIAFFFFGIYGGFINAGLGFILILFLHYYNQLSLVKANASKAVIITIYMAGALLVFILNDKVNWKMGLTMAIGNALGAWFSSRFSVNKGDKFIKLFLLITITIMAIKLWFF